MTYIMKKMGCLGYLIKNMYQMNYILRILVLALLVTGCTAPILFEDSQPSFKSGEVRFKKKYQGHYYDFADSSDLQIDEKSIRMDRFHLGETRMDTMFSISKTNVLKYYKGRYFLNYELDAGEWGLHIIDLKNDQLIFYCFDIPEELMSQEKFGVVKEIRNECGELVKIVVKPTRRGFSELMSEENMKSIVVFDKLSKQAK